MNTMANLNEPILPGTAATDYERYLRTDELLSLQKSAQEVSHRDEHLFQAVHQTSELWLKFACGELEAAIPLVESAQVAEAIRLLRRANDTLSLVIDQLHMLEHMSPIDYAVVRTALGHGAGFDSPGFRRIHHLTPLLGAAFERLLETRRLTLREVYEQGHSRTMSQLAEQLITWDERAILWRFHHLKVVERIIGGNVIGTRDAGRSPGTSNRRASFRTCGPHATRLRGDRRSAPTANTARADRDHTAAARRPTCPVRKHGEGAS
jgi:tryptophan 2,3-dioxygenase